MSQYETSTETITPYEQELTPAKRFERIKQHIERLMLSKQKSFGVIPGPHTTLHDLGREEGGVIYRADGAKVKFNLVDKNKDKEVLNITTTREDTKRTYSYSQVSDVEELTIKSGDYSLSTPESRELANADLLSLKEHLGALALLADSPKKHIYA